MSALGLEVLDLRKKLMRSQNDLPLDSSRDRIGPLSNVNDQLVVLPSDLARSKLVEVGATLKPLMATFCHGPTLLSWAIESDIDGAMIVGIDGQALPAGPSIGGSVIRGEDAADKDDHGDAVSTAIAHPIDIPPEITTRRDLLVKSRSAIRLAAAKRPDSAAIGTPAPGCTVPPAR
ncbi:MAG: hypothetical protein RJB19_750 [Pseudomonadota bacterium]